MTHGNAGRIVLGLGSNLGDRRENLSRARSLIAEGGVAVIARASTVIETEPLGPPQPRYLNQVVIAHTEREPLDLLRQLKDIEETLGRGHGPRWGPRVIDIDILDFDGRVLRSAALCLPHPELVNREFVLSPWAEIAAQDRLPFGEPPGEWVTVSQLLAQLRTRASLRGAATGRVLESTT